MTRTTVVPLWTVPLAIALLMLVAGHLAWGLSVQAGHVPACNPYWDGCTSVSRAARHGLGNHLFRLLMLPCALLLAIHWWLARQWLREPADPRDVAGAWLLGFGLVAAHALAIYVAFLGTEGRAYEFMRRYGITLYFGCGYLALIWFVRLAQRRGRLPPSLSAVMTALCAAMLALGVAKLAADALVSDPPMLDRIADALEWQLALLMACGYLAQAWLWRKERLTLSFAAPQ